MVGKYVKNLIIEYFKDGGWLTKDLASRIFNITNLKEVIEEIKKDGYDIIEVRNTLNNELQIRYLLKQK